MKGHINHLEFFIKDFKTHAELYKKLFEFVGFTKLFEFDQAIAYVSNNDVALIFSEAKKEGSNDRDSVGLNHFTIGVDSDEEVDAFVKEFMVPNKLKPLFGTPKQRPEIMAHYYQVMFTMPGGLLLEVVYNYS